MFRLSYIARAASSSSSPAAAAKVPTQHQLDVLRRKTIRAAKVFSDYNFRQYFIQHTKDRYAKFELPAATPEEAQRFMTESVDGLRQMRRMALVNALYSQQRVILDPKAPAMEPLDYTQHAAPKAADDDEKQ
eukprot:CAMPEP_0176442206 /NCGR_PEP_ID=MMETSP0127-20121128/21672_1 /TAXON_ID=938130 /ORGANISM="Platyophrya macrostoma, Strain WH" /LENGTH=131 /DNA_ID=CAMNT_0017827165 /DNA_START=25 /DNA_END=420 /DNA_ORIENTATION=-